MSVSIGGKLQEGEESFAPGASWTSITTPILFFLFLLWCQYQYKKQPIQTHPNGGVVHRKTIFRIFLLFSSTQQFDVPQHSGGHEPWATAHLPGFRLGQQSPGQLSSSPTSQTPLEQVCILPAVRGMFFQVWHGPRGSWLLTDRLTRHSSSDFKGKSKAPEQKWRQATTQINLWRNILFLHFKDWIFQV